MPGIIAVFLHTSQEIPCEFHAIRPSGGPARQPGPPLSPANPPRLARPICEARPIRHSERPFRRFAGKLLRDSCAIVVELCAIWRAREILFQAGQAKRNGRGLFIRKSGKMSPVPFMEDFRPLFHCPTTPFLAPRMVRPRDFSPRRNNHQASRQKRTESPWLFALIRREESGTTNRFVSRPVR